MVYDFWCVCVSIYIYIYVYIIYIYIYSRSCLYIYIYTYMRYRTYDITSLVSDVKVAVNYKVPWLAVIEAPGGIVNAPSRISEKRLGVKVHCPDAGVYDAPAA